MKVCLKSNRLVLYQEKLAQLAEPKVASKLKRKDMSMALAIKKNMKDITMMR